MEKSGKRVSNSRKQLSSKSGSALARDIGLQASKGFEMLQGSNGERSYDKLQRTERQRRAILRKTELPFWKILACWDGTCLRMLVLDPLLWITVSLYIVIRVLSRIGLPEYVQDLSAGNIGVLGAFLSFFLVFFVVGNNTRFDLQYGLCMAAKGRVLDVASLSRATLPRDTGLRIVRYLNASYAAGFVGLSDVYSFNNFFKEINKTTMLLTKPELKRVQQCNMDAGGSCYRELVQWCQLEIQSALAAGQIDGHLAFQFREKLLAFQGSLSQLYNFADQPIIFFYIHFITLLSALYLPLFAISTAFETGTGPEVYWTADLVSGLIVFLQCIFVIGLRVLGQKLSDPFGADLEDLSVMFYVNFTWTQSNRIMAAEPPKETADGVGVPSEEDIVRDRATIGGAWSVPETIASVPSTASGVEDDFFETYDEPQCSPSTEESTGQGCMVQ